MRETRRTRDAGSTLALALVCVVCWAPSAVAAPPNDDFEDASPVRAGQTVRGTVAGATAEPPHEHEDARSVWYRFRPKRTVLIDVSTCGAKFDPVLEVYAGRSLDSLRRLRSYEGGCRSGFGVALRARRGRSYSIAVSHVPAPGPRVRSRSFRLRVRSIATPPNDDFADALPLRLGSNVPGTTAGATGERGEPRRCCGVPRTVWYRLRVATASHVRLETCRGSAPRLAVYTGSRVDTLVPLVRGFCRVQFAAQPGVSYRVVVDDRAHWAGFRLSARIANPPPNDRFTDATPITLGTTTPGTTRDATLQPYEYSFAAVWFRLGVTEPTTVAVDTCPSRMYLVSHTGDDVNALQQVGTNFGCRVEFEAQPGAPYSISVHSDLEIDFSLRVYAVAAPP